MNAVGKVQVVGGTHFVDRTSLLDFLNDRLQRLQSSKAFGYGKSRPLPQRGPLRSG